MGKLDRLIKDLCPNGVEYVKVDKAFELKNGYTPSKRKNEFWDNGTIPWFTINDIRVNGRVLENAIQKVTEIAVKGGRLVPRNSIIMSTTATIGEHALIKVDALTNQQITSFTIKESYKRKLLTMFAFHYFYIYKEWCLRNSNQSGGMAILNLKKLKEFKIPLPP